jgi:hypothetical protein
VNPRFRPEPSARCGGVGTLAISRHSRLARSLLSDRAGRNTTMNRLQIYALGLATAVIATTAYAAPTPAEIQAPRGQDIQAPRGHDEVQAPRAESNVNHLRR